MWDWSLTGGPARTIVTPIRLSDLDLDEEETKNEYYTKYDKFLEITHF